MVSYQNPSNWFKSGKFWLVVAVLAMLIYQLLYSIIYMYEPGIHRVIHLGFCFVVVFLDLLASNSSSKLKRLFFFILVIFSIAIAIELAVLFNDFPQMAALPPLEYLIPSMISLALCFLVTWYRYGKLFPIMALLSFAFVILGPYFLPPAISPPQVSIFRLMSWAAADIQQEWGVYGNLVGFMANYMWLFMILGAFIQAFGGIRFIQTLGNVVTSKLASGPGMLAVITSALVGMITGVTTANIAITGSFTIPLMKKYGYTPEEAGAIEMSASNGGQIMPPVMGMTAFVMAEFIGVPYARVMLYAIFPALLYFFAVGLYVEIMARKKTIKSQSLKPVEKINVKELLLDSAPFIVPFAIIVLTMTLGFSLMFVGFWSILGALVTGVMFSYLRKGVKIDWIEAKNTIVDGIIVASEMTIVCGLLGAMTAMLEMSGLGITMGSAALELSGGNMFLILLFAAVVCIILGMGLPTVASYVLVATVLAPPLVRMGVPLINVHFFIFFFAICANITPPIGIGILVAAKLAGGRYTATAFEGIKAAYVSFLIPFLYIYTPAILLQFGRLTVTEIATQFTISLVLTINLSILFCNFAWTRLNIFEKVLLAVAFILTLSSVIFPVYRGLLIMIACVVLIISLGLNFRESKALNIGSIIGRA